MKILLIGMRFYGYEYKIRESIERNGYNVTMLFDSPKKFIIPARFHKYFKFPIKDFLCYIYQFFAFSFLKNFDCIVVIVGRNLTVKAFSKLKQQNQKAECILYLWDDVLRVENFDSMKSYYDRIISFDDQDCNKFGFKHLPLFYTNDFIVTTNHKKTLDLYASLWLHSDRLELLSKLKFSSITSLIYLFTSNKTINNIRKRNRFLSDIQIIYTTKSISIKENSMYMKKAKCVIDIPHNSQCGLSLRTIEAIGAQNKIITTNENIKNYDFFCSDNICIIDRNNPIIPCDFILTPYKSLSKEIYDKYHIDNWVCELLK